MKTYNLFYRLATVMTLVAVLLLLQGTTDYTTSMEVYFWRYSPYKYIGTRTADKAGVSYPSGMYSSSYPDWLTYDLSTRGWKNGSSYSLYGGWWEGFGGGCQ